MFLCDVLVSVFSLQMYGHSVAHCRAENWSRVAWRSRGGKCEEFSLPRVLSRSVPTFQSNLTILAVIHYSIYDVCFIMKASGSSETSVQFCQTARCCVADGSNFQIWYCWGMVLSFPLSVINVTGAFWPALGGYGIELASHGSKTHYTSLNKPSIKDDFLSSLIWSALSCEIYIYIYIPL